MKAEGPGEIPPWIPKLWRAGSFLVSPIADANSSEIISLQLYLLSCPKSFTFHASFNLYNSPVQCVFTVPIWIENSSRGKLSNMPNVMRVASG
jgi:hypothetical protein